MEAGYSIYAEKVFLRIKEFKIRQYYQDSIRFMNMLVLTGNMPNIYTFYNGVTPLSIPAPTPERPDPCPTISPEPFCPEPAPTNVPPVCPIENLVINVCFDIDASGWDIESYLRMIFLWN